MPKGWIKGKRRSLESRRKQSETMRKTSKRKHFEKIETLKDELQLFLQENGPIGLYKLREALRVPKLGRHLLMEVVRTYDQDFGYARIRVSAGVGGRKNFTSYELFDGLSSLHIGPVIYLKGDDRIVKFVGSRVIKPKTKGELMSIRYRLNRIFGKELARKMVECAGYEYGKRWKE